MPEPQKAQPAGQKSAGASSSVAAKKAPPTAVANGGSAKSGSKASNGGAGKKGSVAAPPSAAAAEAKTDATQSEEAPTATMAVATAAEPTTTVKSASSVSTMPTTPVKPLRPGSGYSKSSAGGSGTSNGGVTEEVEVMFLESLNKKYECPVCGQVLRYPVQFDECGHRCCSACLPDLLRVAPRCPLDQMTIDKDKVYADKAFQAETDSLGVKCSFFARGCKWTGVLKELMPHLESCDRMHTACPMRCGVEFEKRFLQKHRDEDCPKRQLVCQFCELALLAQDEPEHLEACPKFPLPCPNKCGRKDLTRESLQQHLDTDCMQQSQPCPFANYGCGHIGKKQDLPAHLKEQQVTHMEQLCVAVRRSEKAREEKERLAAELTKKLASIESRIACLEKMYGPQMIWRIDAYQERLAEAKSGKKNTIFSPPFLTHRHGYKIVLSACLYGDGQGRGKYMSVFVSICKSENDPLLVWPFGHRITIWLLDQCEDVKSRRHISYSLKPNTCKENKPFLGRPVGERNASFGAVKFVELETLNTMDYIKDDTIFIKVDVDCDSLLPI